MPEGLNFLAHDDLIERHYARVKAAIGNLHLDESVGVENVKAAPTVLSTLESSKGATTTLMDLNVVVESRELLAPS